jgi:hypothetical protein
MEHGKSPQPDDAGRDASSVEQDACDREAKQRAALDDFKKRTQPSLFDRASPPQADEPVGRFWSLRALTAIRSRISRVIPLNLAACRSGFYTGLFTNSSQGSCAAVSANRAKR